MERVYEEHGSWLIWCDPLPGGWLIAMPRCQPLTDNQWEILQSQGVYDYLPIPVEFKRDSFGVLNGKIVAIDYGS